MSNKISPGCLLCGASTSQQFIKCDKVYGGTPDQAFFRCLTCDVIYLYPVTSEQEDISFYENEFDKWMVKRSGDNTGTDPAIQFVKMQKRELPLRLPWLEKLAKPGQKVLEVGSSSGFTLAVLKEWGCDCTGVELSPEYASYSREQGLHVYSNLNSLNAAESRSFDLLLHYYVLEHVSDPLSFLRKCLSYISSGGKMLFEVPNGEDPLSSLYKIPAFDAFYWWRAHHWYFTRKSLGYLLDKLGRPYEIHAGQRYDLSNHIHWMLTGQPGGMGKYSHIFSADTERSYSEDLKRSWLSDYLIAIVS